MGTNSVNNTEGKIVIHESKKNKVLESSKNGANRALALLKKQTNAKFYDEIDIHLMSRKADLNPFDYYSEGVKLTRGVFSGLFLLGDTDVYINQKRIKARTFTSKNDELNKQSLENQTEYVVLHEIGHFFDEYYGCKINNYEKTMKKIETEILDPYDYGEKIDNVLKNNGFSDEDIFKNALIEDLSKLSYKDIQCLYTGYDKIRRNEDIKECIPEMDSLRSEIFADLFAIILGGKTCETDFYNEKLQKTKKVVSEYIKNMQNYETNNNEKFDFEI